MRTGPGLIPALVAGVALLASVALAEPNRIVLIGGRKSEGPGRHDYPNAIPLFAAQIKASPAFAGMEVLAFSAGWPEDPAAFHGAATVVMYFDGVMQQPPPLSDPARIAQVQELVDQGVGLVCLHQASTVPPGDATIPMTLWLGARRDGMFDRVEEKEPVSLKPASPDHPVAAGLRAFSYRDEFYPTLVWHPERERVTPILTAAIPLSNPRDCTVAWAFERANGGRSFGFTGGHFLAAFTEPDISRMLLNAVAWTARRPVSPGGVAATALVVARSVVTRSAEAVRLPQPWGELIWYTSAAQKNSQSMTTGLATIRPGHSNPRHLHPNCDEVLRVLSGTIRHTMNEVSVELAAGDTVSIPAGTLHNATNIGPDDAVLAISFSSSNRQVVGEGPR
jgi:mannose-6-phosphate isomerase-like protein (cupin superfamily)